VDDLSLKAAAGQVVGLVGPNGSGKSTALRCVYRALRPTSGTVWVGEEELSRLTMRRSAQLIAVTTQDGSVDLDFPTWASEYAKVKMLSDDPLNKEIVVQAKADLVVAGWNSGFSDQRGITPAILDKLGIQSFMHTESCFNYPGHPERVTPFEGLYADLERLGKIFQVEAKASEVVASLRKRVEAVRANAPSGNPVPVFLYDSGTDQPFAAGKQVPPNDIISTAGGRNVFADLDQRWTKVSWEAVSSARPEVVVILDYGDEPADKKIDFLKSSPHTRDLPAVRKNNFFVLDHDEGIIGPRNIDGLEKFAKYLRDLQR
jgi:iron complex transport system substrate-binding protein